MPNPFDQVFNAGPQGLLSQGLQNIWGPSEDIQRQRENILNEERKVQRGLQYEKGQSAAMLEIMQDVARIKQNNPGMAPNELFQTAIQSPVFTRNAVRIPADQQSKLVQDIIKQLNPPDPKVLELDPGKKALAYDPSNPTKSVTEFASNPDLKSQNQQYLLSLPPEQVRQLADIQKLVAKSENPSDKEAAFAWLRDRGLVKDEDAQKFIAGVLKVVEYKNSAGDTIGHALVDLSDPGAPVVRQFGQRAPVGGGQPGAPGAPGQGAALPPNDPSSPPIVQQTQAPPPYQATAAPNAYISPMSRKADIVDVAGLPGVVAGNVGSLLQNVPGAEGTLRDVTAKQNALRHITTAGRALIRDDGDRQLAAEARAIEGMLPDASRWFDSPGKAVDNLIQLHEWSTNMIADANRALSDQSTTNKVRQVYEMRRQKLLSFQSALPPWSDLVQKRDEIASGNYQAPIRQLWDTVKNIPGVISNGYEKATAPPLGGSNNGGTGTPASQQQQEDLRRQQSGASSAYPPPAGDVEPQTKTVKAKELIKGMEILGKDGTVYIYQGGDTKDKRNYKRKPAVGGTEPPAPGMPAVPRNK